VIVMVVVSAGRLPPQGGTDYVRIPSRGDHE
jgi:hypothetical protein